MNTLFVHAVASVGASALLAAGVARPLDDAIRAAIDNPGMPFLLEVSCSDRHTRRASTVYRGEIAIWDGKLQVPLAGADRTALLSLLLESGFSGFEARYGEPNRATKQEAPLRVSCRVHAGIDGHERTSIQLLDGEQSAELLGLAGALLDVIEGHVGDGVAAHDLEDGLAKLSDGKLVPEVLKLRLLRLPRPAAEGFILRIDGGTVSRQPYAPGIRVGEPDTRPLNQCLLRDVTGALADAEPWRLPRNLRGDGTTELDIGVLGAEAQVIARPSFRRADPAATARFDALVERLERLPAGCDAGV